MSIMCCRVPDFLIRLTEQHKPEWAGKPLALLGADELVCAVSAEARQSGVCVEMPRAPGANALPGCTAASARHGRCQAEQGALVGTLAECGLPVEAPSWGVAYVDLRAVATTSQSVQPFCADLGRQGVTCSAMLSSLRLLGHGQVHRSRGGELRHAGSHAACGPHA